MCFTATKHVFPHDPEKTRLKRYRNYDSVCPIKDIILIGGRLVDMGSAVVRRSVFENIPEWYFYKQLWDITVPLLSHKHGKVQYLDSVTSAYRYNVPGSWTQNNVKHLDHRRTNLEKSIKMYDAYNIDTNFQFNKWVLRKINTLLVEILLLSHPDCENFTNYYQRLSLHKKLEYKIFNLIGSYRVWERFIQIKRLLTGH